MLASPLLALALSVATPQFSGDPAALCPPDTLLYFGTQSVLKGAQNSHKSAMSRILGEPEVREFLKQPVSAADKALQQMLKQSEISEADAQRFSIASMMGGGAGAPVGQLFLALTHITIPERDESTTPDIGLIVGMELLNTADLGFVRALWARIPFPEESGRAHGHEVLTKVTPKGLRISISFLGNLALLSLSDTTMNGVLERASQQRQVSSLAASEDYLQLLKSSDNLQPGHMTWIVRTGLIGDALRSELGPRLLADAEVDPELATRVLSTIEALGLHDVRWIGGTSQRDSDGRTHSTGLRSVVSGASGLLPRFLTSPRPIDRAVLEGIPGNCLSMSAGSIDGWVGVYDFAMTALNSFAPAEAAEYQQIVTQLMGDYELREDLLANLNGTLLQYTVPGEGFPGTPAGIFQVNLRNPERFVGALGALLKGASGMFGGGEEASLTETSYEGRKLFEIDLSRTQAAMFGIQPALALKGADLLACFQSSEPLKTALDGLGAATPLSANKEFAEFLDRLSAKGALVAMSFSDDAKVLGEGYGQVSQMAAMMGGALPESVPVDLALLPSEQALTKHLSFSYSGTYRLGDGSTQVSVDTAQFQLGDFLPLLATAGVLFAANELYGAEFAAEPEQVDPLELARRDLGSIRAAMSVYKADQGSYPSTTEDLVKPLLPNFPKGCLSQQEVPTDPWGNAYRYRLGDNGKPVLWSLGPNGMDEGGGGDDIVKK
ncbi:MAG: type II secretion system protein GspG [Planctomycetota bacterium]